MAGAALVGVFAPGNQAGHERLFGALGRFFGVTFVPRCPGEYRGLGAAVVLGDVDGTIPADLKVSGLPVFAAPREPSAGPRGAGGVVRFADGPGIDARLRGRRLLEKRAAAVPLPAVGDVSVLATGPDGAVWTRTSGSGIAHHAVSTSLDELAPGERLKDALTAGRFLSLLPLVQFLRDTFEDGWERPALRASFILDDPNLHWRSYGYLRYPELAAHAREHRYHAGIAMVPLDAAYAHPATVELFRSSPQLSLMVHGNDHVKRELAQPLPRSAAVALLSQAMSRMSLFERRYKLPVNPVMVPPHYDCIEPMMAAMVETGFEAVCYTGPVDVTTDALVGWAPADVHLGAGLPGLHRLPFDAPNDELVLRAFLDQPILLYGHHTDLAKGMNVLAEAACRVNALGEVTWMPSADVARSNFLRRQEGTTLRLRAYSRRLVVSLGEVTQTLRVDLPPAAGPREETVQLAAGASTNRQPTASDGPGLAVRGGADVVIEMAGSADAAERQVGPSRRPAWRPWPIVRRCLTETRDRLSPLLGVEWSQRQEQ